MDVLSKLIINWLGPIEQPLSLIYHDLHYTTRREESQRHIRSYFSGKSPVALSIYMIHQNGKEENTDIYTTRIEVVREIRLRGYLSELLGREGECTALMRRSLIYFESMPYVSTVDILPLPLPRTNME